MTHQEAIREEIELENTIPEPNATGNELIRRKETLARLVALHNWRHGYAPQPPEKFQLSVPDATPEEKERLRKHWFAAFMKRKEGQGRMMAELLKNRKTPIGTK